MTNPDDDVQYRTYHQADPDHVTYRELDGEDDGLFAVRMPLASTGEVRNEGDDPLEREEVDGMAQQINEGDVGVFLAHGDSWEISDARFGQTERLGSWANAELDDSRSDDGESLLMADAVMADPETLPEETGRYRETLAILKEQVKRNIPLSSSIGWRSADDSPGGNDLLEGSIVGIPADPRTTSNTAAAEAAVVHARSVLAESGLDEESREALVEDFRAVVMGSDTNETTHDMTDTTDEADDTNRDESPDGMDEQEYREFMRDQQEQQTELLRALTEALREDDEDDDSDDDDEEEEENEDEDDEEEEEKEDEEQSADTESEGRTVEIDGEEVDAVEEIRRLRDTLEDNDVAVPTPDEDRNDDGDGDGDGADADGAESTTTDRSTDGPDWRA